MQLRTLLSFSFLIFLQTFSFAQQRVVDQLLPMLDTLPPSIEKVDALIALARAYSYCGYADKKYSALEEAENISNQIGYKKGVGQVLIFKNIQQFNEGDNEGSYRSMEQAMAIAEEIGSKDLKLMCDYNLAEWYVYGKADYKKGLEILKKAIKDAGSETSKKNLGNAHRALAICYSDMGDTTLAFQTFRKALDIFYFYESNPDIDPDLGKESVQMLDRGAMNIGQIHEFIGILYENIGRLDLALDHSLTALNIYEEWGAPYFEGGVSLEIADMYHLQGKMDEDLKYLRKAKDNFRLINNEYSEATANYRMGETYKQLGEFIEAKKIAEEALRLFLKGNDSLNLIGSYQSMGDIELALNLLDTAESYYATGFEMAQAMKDSVRMADLAGKLGGIAVQKGDYELGLRYHRLSLSIKQTFNQIAEIPQPLLDISRLFEQWGKPDSAFHYAQAALAHADKINSPSGLKSCHLQLSRLYESAGEFQLALGHHQQYLQYYEQWYSESAQQRLKEEQVRQNVELYEKEKSAAEANAALLAQRNQLYIALVATFLGLFLLSGYLALRLRRSKKEIESQNHQLIDLNKTKDKFFGIIAHDIRSPMVALQSVGQQMEFYLKKERFDKVESLAKLVAQTTQQLDALLDNLLNWALLQRGVMPFHPKPVSLNEAVSEVSGLFAGSLEAKGLNLKKDIPTGLEIQADERALQTTLRNLLSNAIKFTPNGGTVSISSEIVNGKVKIKVKDTGTGIEKSVLDKLFSLERKNTKGTAGERGTGLGLILCKELVEMNKGELSVFSEVGKGSAFEFSLPKN